MTQKSMFLSFAFAALVLGGPVLGQSPPNDPELAQTLRTGGHVIVIRHGATNADMADTDPLNHDNIAMQRQLRTFRTITESRSVGVRRCDSGCWDSGSGANRRRSVA